MKKVLTTSLGRNLSKQPIYEDRLVLYADVLGWGGATTQGTVPAALLEVVRVLHEPATVHNEPYRAYLLEQCAKPHSDIASVNPLFLEKQFGVFSDCFVYSIPIRHGRNILHAASQIILSLLCSGFLVRGAITKGNLYHKDNIVFGPALTNAVNMEENEAFYPRILIADDAAELIDAQPHDPRVKSMILDQLGRRVANPFVVEFGGSDDILLPALKDIFRPNEIDAVIDREIAALKAAGRAKQAEKWEYLASFIRGPVMDASPVLRQVWA
jgi:hypothetical protein